MRLKRFSDVGHFEARVQSFLLEREAVHNLMLGIIGHLHSGTVKDPLMATVERGGKIQLVVLRTPPHPLILSLPTTEEALDTLASTLGSSEFPGVNGPAEVVVAFTRRWAAVTGQRARLYSSQRIYQLNRVVPIAGVPGNAREVHEGDRSVVVPWSSAFVEEALPDDPHDPDAWFDRFLGPEPRTLLVWEVEGELVSMAAAGGPTPNGNRISWVYTPPALRGRGYASACVAALSQRLLDSGRRFCFLYTDLANPTANKLYQRIGYRQVIDASIYHFEDPE